MVLTKTSILNVTYAEPWRESIFFNRLRIIQLVFQDFIVSNSQMILLKSLEYLA